MADETGIAGMADASSATGDANSFDFSVQRIMNRRGTMTMMKVMKPPYDKDGNAIARGARGAVGYLDVLPLVNMLDGAGNAIKHRTVYQLPYTRYQGGKNAVINDPQVDDVGMVFIAHEDLSSVKATGKQANPGSRRRGAYEDGIFLGVVSGGADIEQYVAFTENGIDIHCKNGNSMVFGDTGVVINGVTIPKTGISFNLKTHVHTGVTPGSGESAGPKTGS